MNLFEIYRKTWRLNIVLGITRYLIPSTIMIVFNMVRIFSEFVS